MANDGNKTPHYEFSDKYDDTHARQYFDKLQDGFLRRLATWREIDMARRALVLAGRPHTVLDLPCGTGRFWEMLAEEPGRTIYAADNSQSMIDTGLKMRSQDVTARVKQTFQCSAFSTGLPDDFVECVFSIRLMHHITKSEDRVAMLKEFARISSGTIVLTVWVDGNFKAYRRRVSDERRLKKHGPGRLVNRMVVSRVEIERDFAAAGLEIVGHLDFLKYWDKRRAYVLRVHKG